MSGLGYGKTGRALAIRFFAALCDYYDDAIEHFVESELDFLDEKVATEDEKDPANPQYFNVKAENRKFLARLTNAHKLNDDQIEIENELADYNRKITSNDITELLTRLADKNYNIFVFTAESYSDTTIDNRRPGEKYKEFLVKRRYTKTSRRQNLRWVANIWNKNSPSLKKRKTTTKELEDFVDWITRIKAFQARSFHFDITSNRLKKDFQWDKLPLVDLGLVKPRQENRNIVDRVSKYTNEDDNEKDEVDKKYEHQAFLKEVLEQAKTPKGQGKSIIIGEPGAGKSTLLQQIHRIILDRGWGYPIWISLKELDAINQKNDGEALLDFIYSKWLGYVLQDSSLTASGKKRLEEAQESLKTLFLDETKKIWLLLDGLDEMKVKGVQSSFSAIQKQIDNLKELSPYRIVLTCRQNLWNSYDKNDLRGFDAFYIQKFNFPQVKQFIENWFSLVSKAESGYELIQKLEESKNQNLRYLVSNPLLLTMLCIVYGEADIEKKVTLPETRANLYYEFIPHYYRWKGKEFKISKRHKDRIEDDILPKIALWNFENSSSLYLFPEDELKKFLKKEFGWSKKKLSRWLTRLENTWLQRIGFTKQDSTQAAYCFFHLTFQEYFAAKGIEDWDYFIPRNHINKPIKGKKYRILDDEWREVILFWIGRRKIDTEEKERFIQILLGFSDGINSKLYQEYRNQSLLLSGYCMAEFKSKMSYDICLKICSDDCVEKSMSFLDRKSALTSLIRFFRGWRINSNVRDDAIKRLRAIAPHNQPANAALIELIQDQEISPLIRKDAIRGLTEIAPHNQSNIKFLTRLVLDKGYDELIRNEAIQGLRAIAPRNQSVIDALIKCFKDENKEVYKYLHFNIATTLGDIALHNQSAIDVLIEYLKEIESDEYRYIKVLTSLGAIAPHNQFVIDTLIKTVQNEKYNPHYRSKIVNTLGAIAPHNRLANNALIKLVRDNNISGVVRVAAMHSLRDITPNNQSFIDALIECLKDKEIRGYTYIDAVSILGNIDPHKQFAINALIEFIQNEKNSCHDRREAIDNLGAIAPHNQSFIETLIKFIQDKETDKFFRNHAAKSLGTIIPNNQFAIDALIEIIKGENVNSVFRLDAFYSLEAIASHNQSAIRFLTELLQNKKTSRWVRFEEARCLGIIDPQNQFAIDALIELFKMDDLDDDFEGDLTESLDTIALNNQHAIASLIRILQDKETSQYKKNEAARSLKSINKLNYTTFYNIWHYKQAQEISLFNTSINIDSTEYCYPLVINITQLKNVTSSTIIVQQIYNQIYKSYKAKLGDYLKPTISKIATWSDLDTWLLNLNMQLPQTDLALVLENCDPNPELIDILEKIANTVHVCCITDKIIQSSVISTISPQSSDLQSAVNNWLKKLNDQLEQ